MSVRNYHSTLCKIPKKSANLIYNAAEACLQMTYDIHVLNNDSLLRYRSHCKLATMKIVNVSAIPHSSAEDPNSQEIYVPLAAAAQYCIMLRELKEKQTCLLRHCEPTKAPA